LLIKLIPKIVKINENKIKNVSLSLKNKIPIKIDITKEKKDKRASILIKYFDLINSKKDKYDKEKVIMPKKTRIRFFFRILKIKEKFAFNIKQVIENKRRTLEQLLIIANKRELKCFIPFLSNMFVKGNKNELIKPKIIE
jgi:hypothetical protein